MNIKDIRVVGFDADDTLWVNEPIFQDVVSRFIDLLSNHTNPKLVRARLIDVEMRNLKLFGYGIKGFVLSMAETAVEISQGAVTGKEIRQILDMGKEMMQQPVELINGVEEVLQTLQGPYRLMLITKGDLFDQESKISRSNLADYFSDIEILTEKNEQAYENVLARHRISNTEFLMIGNSLKSDVMPVVNIGSQAVHIPFHTTWEHEQIELPQEHKRPYMELGRIEEVVPLLRVV